jgi:MFS family permease
MFTYIGIALGDFLSGSLSQLFKTRKKIVFFFLSFTFAGILFFLHSYGMSDTQFYMLCVYFGLATGYWVVFVTMAAEQFGTNLRATVTTTVPNMVRGSLILVTLAFTSLKDHFGLVNAAIIVGTGTVSIAYWALWHLEETFGKDLDYMEESGEIGL